MPLKPSITQLPKRAAFTLVEVVLAIGILGISVLSLMLMFGPTMKSVQEVVGVSEASSAAQFFDTFLQNQVDGVQTPGVNVSGGEGFDGVGKWVFDKASFYYYSIVDDKGTESPVDDERMTRIVSDPQGIDLFLLSGSVMRIDIAPVPSKDEYNYDNFKEEAHLPMLVSLYAVDASNPTNTGTEIITYRAAVLR